MKLRSLPNFVFIIIKSDFLYCVTPSRSQYNNRLELDLYENVFLEDVFVSYAFVI